MKRNFRINDNDKLKNQILLCRMKAALNLDICSRFVPAAGCHGVEDAQISCRKFV